MAHNIPSHTLQHLSFYTLLVKNYYMDAQKKHNQEKISLFQSILLLIHQILFYM